MSSPGTLTTALNFVPSWWQDGADKPTLDALLSGVVKACGWRGAGFVWPAEGVVTVAKTAHGANVTDGGVPPEVPDAVRRTKAGEATAFYSVAGSSGRVFAPVMPPGRPMGLLWVDHGAGQPWSEQDRAYLALTAKMMERSPAVFAAIGPVIEPDKLNQRLGDAAVIAGRMAHDFDNILTGIIGFADLAAPTLPVGSPALRFVTEIGKVGQRGIVFTQQLHHLSRSAQVKPNPGAVSAAVQKEEQRVRGSAPANTRIEKDIPPNMPSVALEAGPLQTVIGHLLENAVEACPSGGLVRVSAEPVELAEPEARSYLGRAGAGAFLRVTITDTGTGIKPEHRRRLFVEPFFTTKVRHRGLGLAVAYRILFAHRGGILIDPVPPPGTGTHVRVVLPLAAARPPAALAGVYAATTVGG
ncbi:MAG TPA: ATP-binding protein [Gemmataceae bacterium]|nr:ATP-binding protein [Gemmataceae bacterium]